ATSRRIFSSRKIQLRIATVTASCIKRSSAFFILYESIERVPQRVDAALQLRGFCVARANRPPKTRHSAGIAEAVLKPLDNFRPAIRFKETKCRRQPPRGFDAAHHVLQKDKQIVGVP